MTAMPILETERLLIRPFRFDDLEVVHQILVLELSEAETGSSGLQSLDLRRRWLDWTVLGYELISANLYERISVLRLNWRRLA